MNMRSNQTAPCTRSSRWPMPRTTYSMYFRPF
jgi:hypothetical protein